MEGKKRIAPTVPQSPITFQGSKLRLALDSERSYCILLNIKSSFAPLKKYFVRRVFTNNDSFLVEQGRIHGPRCVPPPQLSARLKSIELACFSLSPLVITNSSIELHARDVTIPHFQFISAVKYTRFRGFETKALQMDGQTDRMTDRRMDGQTLL